jgi:serine/threonine-protein kinase
VHDFGFEDGVSFIVMELVPRTDLKTMIKQRGKFSVDEAINLIVQPVRASGTRTAPGWFTAT